MRTSAAAAAGTAHRASWGVGSGGTVVSPYAGASGQFPLCSGAWQGHLSVEEQENRIRIGFEIRSKTRDEPADVYGRRKTLKVIRLNGANRLGQNTGHRCCSQRRCHEIPRPF